MEQKTEIKALSVTWMERVDLTKCITFSNSGIPANRSALFSARKCFFGQSLGYDCPSQYSKVLAIGSLIHNLKKALSVVFGGFEAILEALSDFQYTRCLFSGCKTKCITTGDILWVLKCSILHRVSDELIYLPDYDWTRPHGTLKKKLLEYLLCLYINIHI